MFRKNELHRGQVALITLLVLTVATTVGLSLIARTTTNTSVTRNIEESTRAFSAAEAGLEESLKSGIGSAGAIDPTLGVSYIATVSAVSAGVGSPFVFAQKTPNENTETVWLVNHSATGTIIETPTYTAAAINVCWSSESTTPALIVSVLYKESSDGSYRIAKAAYDPDSSRAATNNFLAPTASTGGCAGTNTTYRSVIQFSNFVPSINPAVDTLIALRIRPVYSAAFIAIAPNQNLPFQGNRIQSTGRTDSGVNRKIVVYQQYRTPESIFDYAVYSQGSFSQ